MSTRLGAVSDYGWNGSRYYDLETGKFVSSAAVRDALESVMDASALRMNNLSEKLLDGSISLAQWQAGMMQQIKLAHTAAGAAANGGWAQMTQSDWGAVGQKVKEQYQYLRNFAGQIADGTQGLNGQVLVRSDLYGDASRGTFEAMRQRLQIENGMEEERRVLGDADHCDDCLDAAGEGWQPIGTLPQIGDSVCITRCHCSFEYRRQTESGEWEESEE